MNPKLKMYILIRDSVPDRFAPVVSAHASLGCYLKYKDHPMIQKWLEGIFYKVVVRVNDTEFEAAKQFADVHVQTEAGLDGIEATISMVPREEWPKPVKFYRLWKPREPEKLK